MYHLVGWGVPALLTLITLLVDFELLPALKSLPDPGIGRQQNFFVGGRRILKLLAYFCTSFLVDILYIISNLSTGDSWCSNSLIMFDAHGWTFLENMVNYLALP